MARTRKLVAATATAATLVLGGAGGVADYQASLAPISAPLHEEEKIQKDGKYRVIVQVDRGQSRKRPYRVWEKDTKFDKRQKETTFTIIDGSTIWLTQQEIDELRLDPNVKSISYDRIDSQEMLDENIPYVFSGSTIPFAGATGSGIKVCVMDGGWTDHPYSKAPTASFNAPQGRENQAVKLDYGGHATFVNGIIFSQHPIYKGAAPEADMYIVKPGTAANQISSMQWCYAQGARVFTQSFGGGTSNCAADAEAIAVATLANSGALFFVAAGNGNDVSDDAGSTSTPGCSTGALRIGSISKATRTKSGFSDGGLTLSFVTNGENIVGLNNAGDISDANGTSFSAPLAAGFAAALWSLDPTMTRNDLIHILSNTADDLGTAGKDNSYGSGAINMHRAINAVRARLGQPALSLPTLIFKEDFEDAFVDWTNSGGWQSTTSNAYPFTVNQDFPNGLGGGFSQYKSNRYLNGTVSTSTTRIYPDDCASECTLTMTGSLRLATYTGAIIRFYAALTRALEDSDYLQVDAFDGVDWRPIMDLRRLDFVQQLQYDEWDPQDPQWGLKQYVLSGSFMTDSFKLRFRAKSQRDGIDSADTTNREMIVLDQLTITEFKP